MDERTISGTTRTARTRWYDAEGSEDPGVARVFLRPDRRRASDFPRVAERTRCHRVLLLPAGSTSRGKAVGKQGGSRMIHRIRRALKAPPSLRAFLVWMGGGLAVSTLIQLKWG